MSRPPELHGVWSISRFGLAKSAERITTQPLRDAMLPRRLETLEAGRGCAALGVVLFHSGQAIQNADFDPILHAIIFSGQNGIFYFFVLSGFVILHAHHGDIGVPQRGRRYLLKRINRIYPPYWIVLGSIMPVFFLSPSLGLPEFRELTTIVSAVFLIGEIAPTPLTVAWTLFHEMLFYLMFLTLVLSRRLGLCVLIGWLVVCASDLAYSYDMYVVSSLNLLFAMGMACAWFYRIGRLPSPALVLAFGVGTFAIGSVFGHAVIGEKAAQIVLGVASALIILSLACLERDGRLSCSRPFLMLGSGSYALYLVHGPVISALTKLDIQFDFFDAPLLAVATMTVIAIAAGFIFHWIVERPLLDLSRRWITATLSVSARA